MRCFDQVGVCHECDEPIPDGQAVAVIVRFHDETGWHNGDCQMCPSCDAAWRAIRQRPAPEPVPVS